MIGIVNSRLAYKFNLYFINVNNESNYELVRMVTSVGLKMEDDIYKLIYKLRVPIDKKVNDILKMLNKINEYQLNILCDNGDVSETINIKTNTKYNYTLNFDYASDNPLEILVTTDVELIDFS